MDSNEHQLDERKSIFLAISSAIRLSLVVNAALAFYEGHLLCPSFN